MQNKNTKVIYIVAFLVSALAAGLLLAQIGVDASQANVFSWSTFSFSVFVVFGICLHWFYQILLTLFTKFSKFKT